MHRIQAVVLQDVQLAADKDAVRGLPLTLTPDLLYLKSEVIK